MAVFVPDASATLAWFFEDETSDWTDALLQSLKSVTPAGSAALASGSGNAFLMAMRRGRIRKDKISRFVGDLLALPIRMDSASSDTTFNQVFACSETYRLTVYDAASLGLAMRERIPWPLWMTICVPQPEPPEFRSYTRGKPSFTPGFPAQAAFSSTSIPPTILPCALAANQPAACPRYAPRLPST